MQPSATQSHAGHTCKRAEAAANPKLFISHGILEYSHFGISVTKYYVYQCGLIMRHRSDESFFSQLCSKYETTEVPLPLVPQRSMPATHQRSLHQTAYRVQTDTPRAP